MRFVKNVGLGFKTPKTAREGTYVDKKCPFTGDVSIRGRILKVIHNFFSNLLLAHAWKEPPTPGSSARPPKPAGPPYRRLRAILGCYAPINSRITPHTKPSLREYGKSRVNFVAVLWRPWLACVARVGRLAELAPHARMETCAHDEDGLGFALGKGTTEAACRLSVLAARAVFESHLLLFQD